MKILITGGAGFIGSHTADALIALGHEVRLLDNLHPTVHPRGKPDYLHPRAEFVYGDVREAVTLRQALQGVEAVYHLAAYQDYLPDFSTFFSVNAVSTALLYEIIVAERKTLALRKVIVAASQAVMGEGRYHCPTCSPTGAPPVYPQIRLEHQLARGQWDHLCQACGGILQWLPSDETVVNPCNQYALSKHAQEQIALQLGRRYDIPSVVMRYAIVQGQRQSLFNAYSGAMRIFALSLLFERPPMIFEDGRQIRDYVNIEDVVAANLKVLDDPRADMGIFNVGGGQAWSVAQFYERMQSLVGKRIEPVTSGLYRFGDTRHIFSDTTRIGRLGWTPVRTVDDSIQAYWDFLGHQRDNPDVLAQAERQMRHLNVIRQSHRPQPPGRK